MVKDNRDVIESHEAERLGKHTTGEEAADKESNAVVQAKAAATQLKEANAPILKLADGLDEARVRDRIEGGGVDVNSDRRRLVEGMKPNGGARLAHGGRELGLFRGKRRRMGERERRSSGGVQRPVCR